MKLLLLDLDDTLVDDHSAVRAAFSAFVAFHAPALKGAVDPLKRWQEIARYRITYQSNWRLFTEVPDFLARTASLTKVILTNSERGQQRLKVEMVGLGPHITEVITPMDCGAWKPDPRIYLETLRL